MFYRSSSRILLAALIAATLGAFAPTRADDRTSDLEGQLKKKEAEYKELQQKLQSLQTAPFEQASQAADQAMVQADAVRSVLGQSPIRVRVQLGATNAIHSAAAEVRDAKGDDERKVAQKKLDEALGKYFDDDMVQREKDLKQVEERVTKLHELLERRRAGKQEIIDLEAKVVLNEANGLGFYDGEAAGGPAIHPFFSYGKSASSGGSGSGFGSTIMPRVKAAPPTPPTKPTPPTEPPSADK